MDLYTLWLVLILVFINVHFLNYIFSILFFVPIPHLDTIPIVILKFCRHTHSKSNYQYDFHFFYLFPVSSLPFVHISIVSFSIIPIPTSIPQLKEIETAQSTLLEEKQSIVAKANMKGFLLKRGVRGPTGRKWRRRFFRTDGAGRLCYYKIAEDTTPLG